jgi:heptosyltransferase-2
MEPRNIIIRGPNWLGDAVLGIPAMRAVRNLFSDAEITLLILPEVAGLFRSARYIDTVWARPRSGFGDWYVSAQEVHRRRFDLAILLPNSFVSALTAFAGRVPERIGYATDGRSMLLTRAVTPPGTKLHQVGYYMHLIQQAFGQVPQPALAIRATDDERTEARQLFLSEGLDPEQAYIVVNPGAAFGSAKRWPEDRYAALADRVAEELGAQVVIVGSDSERPIAERVRSAMQRPATLLSGKTTLETLIGVLADAALVLTNDSGPMHIAAALGVPTTAVFGSTDSQVTSPVGVRTRVVRHGVSCSPCLLRECPIDHRCMERVTVEQVYEAAVRLVAPGQRRA